MTKLARAIHGIPVVVSTLARAAMFPTPETDQRVHNLETGFIERFNGSQWLRETQTGSAGVTIHAFAKGAAGDGTTNDATAINAAIASVAAAGGGTVVLGSSHLVTSAINLSNLGDTPVTLAGVGFTQTGTGTTIRGGTGGVVIDTVGSQYVTLRDIRIYTDGTESSPSTVGILQGRSALHTFAQFHNYENVIVFLPSNTGAGARGTIGIYNVAGEHASYKQVRCIADLPWAFAATDVLGVPSPNAGAHSGAASMTFVDLKQCTAGAWTYAGYEFWDAQNITLDVYSNRLTGTYTYPLNFNGDCRSFRVTGQFEQWPGLANFNGSVIGMDWDVVSVSPTTTLFGVPNAITWTGGRIRVVQIGGSVQYFFNVGAGCAGYALDITMLNGQGIDAAALTLHGCIVRSHSPGAAGVTVASGSTYEHITDSASVHTNLKVGASGTVLTQGVVYTPSITPSSVSAATVAEQTFTVSGLTTADKVIVNPPSIANATGIVGARVSAADTLAIRFVNPTAGALTPTAGTYTVLAIRS